MLSRSSASSSCSTPLASNSSSVSSTSNVFSKTWRRAKLTCGSPARCRDIDRPSRPRGSIRTGRRTTAASAGRPSSSGGHVAMPKARNSVSKPLSSKFASARRRISRARADSFTRSALGRSLLRVTGSPSNREAMASESACVRSTVPSCRFL